MPHPFVLCYNSNRPHMTRSVLVPQQASYLAIVAFAPGRRVDGFNADFSSPYPYIECSQKRKFAFVDGIEMPPQPLRKEGSRSHLVKDEMNVKVLCELMKLLFLRTVPSSILLSMRWRRHAPRLWLGDLAQHSKRYWGFLNWPQTYFVYSWRRKG